MREDPNELDFGVVENHEISIKGWEKALADFEENELWLNGMWGSRIGKGAQKLSPRYLATPLSGGTMGGICRKAGRRGKYVSLIDEVLACSDCAPDFEKELEHAEGGCRVRDAGAITRR